jgi:hypothetical protein
VGAADARRPGRLPPPGAADGLRQPLAWFLPRRRALWAIRFKAGELLGWDGPDQGHGLQRPMLRDRLPPDLRDTPSGPDFRALPFTSLYLTGDEWAAEAVNRAVHAVMHVGWVPHRTGGYRGQMAVLVKPSGLLGSGYMAVMAPLRHLIVYPAMIRQIGRRWQAPACH